MNQKKGINQSTRGRAALSNETSRFDLQKRESFDDGWALEEEEERPKREVIVDKSRSILNRNQSPDIPFEQSINPYRGCEHGCIYCFARPTHAYLGHSPGLDFETKIHIKPQSKALLAEELSQPKYRCTPIAMGTNTDPYQPIEKELQITRQILAYLLERKHPVSIVTKGALINRDLDILSKLAELDLVCVFVSITTLNNRLHRKMEPRAMAPKKRLETIEALTQAGVPTGVMAAPMIPRLNDMELEAILASAQKYGAQSAGYILLRLPLEVSALFREWLSEHYPDRASKVLKHIQDTRGGKDNQSDFGERMTGSGEYAALLRQRFHIVERRLGFQKSLGTLRTDLFQKPPNDPRQMELFL